MPSDPMTAERLAEIKARDSACDVSRETTIGFDELVSLANDAMLDRAALVAEVERLRAEGERLFKSGKKMLDRIAKLERAASDDFEKFQIAMQAERARAGQGGRRGCLTPARR